MGRDLGSAATVRPRSEWSREISIWNDRNPDQRPAEPEHVEEALLALARWRCCIAAGRPADERERYLERHHYFARRVPDELLLLLTDDE